MAIKKGYRKVKDYRRVSFFLKQTEEQEKKDE